MVDVRTLGDCSTDVDTDTDVSYTLLILTDSNWEDDNMAFMIEIQALEAVLSLVKSVAEYVDCTNWTIMKEASR